MTKKRTATLAVCAVLLFCVIAAGCTGPTASPTPTPTPTPKPTLKPTLKPTPTPTPTPTPIPASLTVQYFYEVNCPVCQNFSPQVYQLQNDLNTKHPGKVTVVMINNPDDYGVHTVPTLVLLNHGTEVGRWVNPGTTAPIAAQIDSLLASG